MTPARRGEYRKGRPVALVLIAALSRPVPSRSWSRPASTRSQYCWSPITAVFFPRPCPCRRRRRLGVAALRQSSMPIKPLISLTELTGVAWRGSIYVNCSPRRGPDCHWVTGRSRGQTVGTATTTSVSDYETRLSLSLNLLQTVSSESPSCLFVVIIASVLLVTSYYSFRISLHIRQLLSAFSHLQYCRKEEGRLFTVVMIPEAQAWMLLVI